MKLLRQSRWESRRQAAFSLLELLVAVGLLSVVVLALYAMFDQTQKALHRSIAQTDVMEGGRSAFDLVVRDVERAHPTGVTGPIELPVYNLVVRKFQLAAQAGPGSRDIVHRDSTFSELFYMLPVRDRLWTAAGLYVASETDASQPVSVINGVESVGTLYRYQAPSSTFVRGPAATTSLGKLTSDLINNTATARNRRASNSTRLLDGVVFFRVLPYGGSGLPLDEVSISPKLTLTNIIIARPKATPPTYLTAFTGSAMPSAVEIEFGVLPPKSLIQYRSVPDNLKAGYLNKHAAEILLFRQRIALRSAIP